MKGDEMEDDETLKKNLDISKKVPLLAIAGLCAL